MQTSVTCGAVLLCMHVILVLSKTFPIPSALNHIQCQSLCWYRRPCTAYSINMAIPSNSDVTCMLHTDPWQDMDVPTGWQTHNASNAGIQHGCRDRQCSSTQTCVPVGSSLTEYKCLTLPIDCGTPLSPANGTFTFHGTSVGQVATLSCDQHFVLVPQNAPTQARCTASSDWTTLNATCQQVSFTEGLVIPFKAGLRWLMAVGWEACVKGTFLGPGQMAIDFIPGMNNFTPSDNINLHLAFRQNLGGIAHSLVVSKSVGLDKWDDLDTIPNMPLEANDSFTMTLHLNASHLTVVLHPSVFTASILWLGRTDILTTAFLVVRADVQLDYVNVNSTLSCF